VHTLLATSLQSFVFLHCKLCSSSTCVLALYSSCKFVFLSLGADSVLLTVQIAQISGASVTTRGRYMTEDELSREEPGYSVSYLVLLCSGLVMSKLVMGQVLS